MLNEKNLDLPVDFEYIELYSEFIKIVNNIKIKSLLIYTLNILNELNNIYLNLMEQFRNNIYKEIKECMNLVTIRSFSVTSILICSNMYKKGDCNRIAYFNKSIIKIKTSKIENSINNSYQLLNAKLLNYFTTDNLVKLKKPSKKYTSYFFKQLELSSTVKINPQIYYPQPKIICTIL